MLRAKSSQLSFYGNHIYDRVITDNHFLKLLDKRSISPSSTNFAEKLILLIWAGQPMSLK